MSAYNLYFHRNKQPVRDFLRQQFGRSPTMKEMAKEMGRRWTRICPSEKAHFQHLAAKDKRRYCDELIAWKLQTEANESRYNADQGMKYEPSNHEDDDAEPRALAGQSFVPTDVASQKGTNDYGPKSSPRSIMEPSLQHIRQLDHSKVHIRPLRLPCVTVSNHNMKTPAGFEVASTRFSLENAAAASFYTAQTPFWPVPLAQEDVNLFADDDVLFLQETFGFGDE